MACGDNASRELPDARADDASAGDAGLVEAAGGDDDSPAEAGNLDASSEAGAGAVVLADSEDDAACIAIDGTYLYWGAFNAPPPSGSGTIRRVAKGGGQPSTLVTRESGVLPFALAVDAQNVYWTELAIPNTGTSSSVMQMPLAGGTPLTLATSLAADPEYLVVAAGSVYWTSFSTGAPDQDVVQSVPIGGGAVTSVAQGQAGSGAIASDGTYLYYATLTATNRIPLAGGPPQAIGPAALALAVDATDVYFAYTPRGASTAAIARFPVAGGTVTGLADGRSLTFGNIVLDDGAVYWVEGKGTVKNGGAIATVPKSGGSPSVIAPSLDNPRWVVIDATSAYFITASAIEKVAK